MNDFAYSQWYNVCNSRIPETVAENRYFKVKDIVNEQYFKNSIAYSYNIISFYKQSIYIIL